MGTAPDVWFTLAMTQLASRGVNTVGTGVNTAGPGLTPSERTLPTILTAVDPVLWGRPSGTTRATRGRWPP